MKTFAMFAFGLLLAAASGNAITMYRGQLMDASCYQQNLSNTSGKIWVTCAPTDTTTTFAIHTNQRVRMLDAAGNDKAQAAFKQGILKRDPNSDMPVVVAGYRHGNTIKVENIRARGSNTSVH
jgi:hypothetical protein